MTDDETVVSCNDERRTQRSTCNASGCSNRSYTNDVTQYVGRNI